MDGIDHLYASLDSRQTPEAVCSVILQVLGTRLPAAQRRLLHRAAGTATVQYSSMGDDFERPVPLDHKVAMLAALLRRSGLGRLLGGGDVSPQALAELADDPWRLLGELRKIGQFIGWHPAADYRSRCNRQQRRDVGVTISRRQYNRLVRHLLATQDAARHMGRLILIRQLVLVGRSGLAYTITPQEMRADPFAAAFVAYWTAQKNRRRAATTAARDNPFDTIAEMLLGCCRRRPDTDWWMIARAYPEPVILAGLDDGRRGWLLGQWMSYMRVAAGLLKDLYQAWPETAPSTPVPAWMWADRPGLMPPELRNPAPVKVIDLKRMKVAAGVDSSTWNTVAAAYNAARHGWLNCLGASGALDLLDVCCPGKAMRLVAGDVTSWHQAEGSDTDAQARVWAELPLPWQVLSGQQPCPADLVEGHCSAHGVDPHAAGWTAPRQTGGTVADWKPTPELVHGIEVSDPLWAGLLRRSGVWSGEQTPEGADAFAAYLAASATTWGGGQ